MVHPILLAIQAVPMECIIMLDLHKLGCVAQWVLVLRLRPDGAKTKHGLAFVGQHIPHSISYYEILL